MDVWVIAGSAREAEARRGGAPRPVRIAFKPPAPGASGELLSLTVDLAARAPSATALLRARWSERGISCSLSVEGEQVKLAPIPRLPRADDLERALTASLAQIDWTRDIRSLSLEVSAQTPLSELAMFARVAYAQSAEGLARRGARALSVSLTLTPP